MSTLKERLDHNILVMAGSLPSIDPTSYFIEPRDYKRNNSDERHYRSKWLLLLLRTYDCRCGLCGADRDGFELDHFWLPKSKGGNFLLRDTFTRKLINNAVPLCVHCNRAKGERSVDLSPSQALRLAEANREMTAAINDVPDIGRPASLRGFEPGDEYRDAELGDMPADILLKRAMRSHRSIRSEESGRELRDAVDRYLTRSL